MLMAISALSGTGTSTVKVNDINTVITALNAELAGLGSRITALEGNLATAATHLQMLDERIVSSGEQVGDGMVVLGARIAALESEPDPVIPPDLTTRVQALEEMVQRAPAENPSPIGAADRVGRPHNLPTDKMVLVYDRATIYYNDLELYADRIGVNQWRLYAQLNYMVITPAVWTYDEIFEGTAEEVYAHAVGRLQELAKLKPIHDSVHERVVAMSEGRK